MLQLKKTHANRQNSSKSIKHAHNTYAALKNAAKWGNTTTYRNDASWCFQGTPNKDAHFCCNGCDTWSWLWSMENELKLSPKSSPFWQDYKHLKVVGVHHFLMSPGTSRLYLAEFLLFLWLVVFSLLNAAQPSSNWWRFYFSLFACVLSICMFY